MGSWAATVRFASREEAHAFLEDARAAGAHAMLHVDAERGWTVTILGEEATLDAALARADNGTVVRREPAATSG